MKAEHIAKIAYEAVRTYKSIQGDYAEHTGGFESIPDSVRNESITKTLDIISGHNDDHEKEEDKLFMAIVHALEDEYQEEVRQTAEIPTPSTKKQKPISGITDLRISASPDGVEKEVGKPAPMLSLEHQEPLEDKHKVKEIKKSVETKAEPKKNA